jgi:hypothetical protein
MSHHFLSFFFFCSSEDWTQGLWHAWQALYHLCHTPNPSFRILLLS